VLRFGGLLGLASTNGLPAAREAQCAPLLCCEYLDVYQALLSKTNGGGLCAPGGN